MRGAAAKSGGVNFVCMTPETDYYAQKKNLAYASVDSFFDAAGYTRGAPSHMKECEALAASLNPDFDASFRGIHSEGYFDAVDFVYTLTTYHDAAAGMFAKLKPAIETTSPKKVICFLGDDYFPGFRRTYRTGGLVPNLLKMLKGDQGYELIIHGAGAENDINKRTAKDEIARAAMYVPLFLKKRMQRGEKGRIDPAVPAIAIGASNTQADLMGLAKDWLEIGGRVESLAGLIKENVTLSPSDFKDGVLAKFGMSPKSLDEFRIGLKSKPSLAKYFSAGGSELYSIVGPWLGEFIREDIPLCVHMSRRFEERLKNCGAKAFMTPSVVDVKDVAAVLACRRLGIKVCSVQHGGMGFHKVPIIEYTDYKNMDYAFVHGEGVARFFEEEFGAGRREGVATPVPVGNILVKRVFKRQRAEAAPAAKMEKRVLYVPTHFVTDFVYHSYYYPNIWYSRFQRRLVDAFGKYPDTKFFVKRYPMPGLSDPLEEYVKSAGIGNIEFLPKETLISEYMGECGAYIIDYPSTTLPIVLCTRRPVIFYCNTDYTEFSKDAAVPLRKRADFCTTEDELFAAVGRLCTTWDWIEPKEVDDEFLRLYGTYRNDTEPEKEAAKRLAAITGMKSAQGAAGGGNRRSTGGA